MSEHVYCADFVTFKMTEQIEQRICIQFCIKLECSSVQMTAGNYSDESEGRSSGQLVIGSFTTTTHPLTHHVLCRVSWQNVKSPR